MMNLGRGLCQNFGMTPPPRSDGLGVAAGAMGGEGSASEWVERGGMDAGLVSSRGVVGGAPAGGTNHPQREHQPPDVEMAGRRESEVRRERGEESESGSGGSRGSGAVEAPREGRWATAGRQAARSLWEGERVRGRGSESERRGKQRREVTHLDEVWLQRADAGLLPPPGPSLHMERQGETRDERERRDQQRLLLLASRHWEAVRQKGSEGGDAEIERGSEKKNEREMGRDEERARERESERVEEMGRERESESGEGERERCESAARAQGEAMASWKRQQQLLLHQEQARREGGREGEGVMGGTWWRWVVEART